MRPSAWRFSSIQNAVLLLMIGFVDDLVSSEVAEGCSGELTLNCQSGTVIEVQTVLHGLSGCRLSCCIDGSSCFTHMSDSTKKKVKNCNGRQNCNSKVVWEKLNCRYYLGQQNHVQRITYNCMHASITTDITPDYSSNSEDDNTGDTDNHETDEEQKKFWLMLALAAVCVVVLIFIIILVAVIIIKRKQFPPLKESYATQTPGTDNGNETISLNQIQRTKQNQNGASSSALDGNNTSSTARNKPQNSQNTLCEAQNGVYSLALEPGSLPNSVYSTVEKKEPEYLVQNENRTNIYSLVEDGDDSTLHTGASKNTPGDGGDIYYNVNSIDPAKMTSQATLGIYSNACQWQEEPYEEVCLSVPAQKANLKTNKNYPLAQTGSNIKDVKANTGGDITKQKNTCPSVNDSDLSYEIMSEAESIYANDPASGHRHQLESVGSDSTTSYCNMQSPKVKLNNDGAQIVIENDLYSH